MKKDAKRRAAMIVEYMLDYIQATASIVGRSKERRLVLGGGMLNMKTGRIRDHTVVMREAVAKIIDGDATYRASRRR